MTSGDRMEALLEELLIWTKVSAYTSVSALLESALKTDNVRLAYQALDGSRTLDSVKKECGIGSNTLAAMVARCCAMGLMSKANGSTRRHFDLNDFGLLPTKIQDVESGGDK